MKFSDLCAFLLLLMPIQNIKHHIVRDSGVHTEEGSPAQLGLATWNNTASREGQSEKQ